MRRPATAGVWGWQAVRSFTAVIRRQVRLGACTLRDWRLTVAWARSLARSFFTSLLVLSVTFWLLPGVTATGGPWAMVWLVILVALVGMLLRPLLVSLAVALGGVAALVLGVCIQALVMYIALRLDSGVTVHGGVISAAGVAWLAAALAALVNWLADAGSEDVFLGQVRRRMARDVDHVAGPERPPGLLIVQLDGLAAPLLRWAVQTGNLPNLRRFLHGDPLPPGRAAGGDDPVRPVPLTAPATHRFASWHTGLPSTTPAGQAGLLYGDTSQVPAFRWYEKESGRLMVANRPRDAAVIESRLAARSRGLLADGGVSISNMFSGGASLGLLTVSSATLPGRSIRGYAAFMLNPYGLVRAVVLSVGEILKELQQARRQKRRNVYPRVSRFGSYVLLRPLSNILLRDLNVALIAEQMAGGAPVIFCDFVDYDEVAHHAGPARPEAMQTLEGLDRVLGTLHRISADAARAYELVVVSDHGQSQGAPFAQRHGERLESVVHRLAGGSAVAATAEVESWGPVNTLLTGLAGGHGVTGAATRAATRCRRNEEVTLGPAEREERAVEAGAGVVVVASGNLAMVYLTDSKRRLTLDELLLRHPDLVAGLASHPGIGVVVVDTVDHGPVAIGSAGSHRLADGVVEGVDPLLPFGRYAARDLLAHQQLANVGDLVLVSAYDPVTEEVCAFEELVGCHGGLGGWQTEAVLVYPTRFTLSEPELVGADAVYRELAGWRRELGLDENAVAPASGGGLLTGLAPPAKPRRELAEQQDHHDGRDDALPRLGEERAAEQADRGVHR
jgi:uncharacterized membrane protein YvlD (DUF360 family)